MQETNKNVPMLKIEHLTKIFSGTRALDNVSFDVYPGEIHALLGENGAGKSTLIKILSGLYTSDRCDITFKGRPFSLKTEKLPLSVIHQDLGVIDDLSVMENIAVISGYKKSHGLIMWKKTREHAKSILSRMDCEIDVDSVVGELPSAERSMVAISRALAVDSDILILDEPTATLPQNDVDKLFQILRKLRQEGLGIIYVSHRLDEVFQLADRVTVLRNGKNVSSNLVKDVTKEKLIFDIIGKKSEEIFVKTERAHSDKIDLSVKKLYADFVRDVSFDLHKGEILTLFGLRGAGHHEVGRVLFGMTKPDSMEMELLGKPVALKGADDALKHGIGFLSSKRLEESLAPLYSVRENIYINPVVNGKGLFSVLNKKDEIVRAQQVVESFSVKPNTTENLVGTLSGGNQQKTVLARLFEANPQIFILEEPTIGVDIGAKADIYMKMNEAINSGKSIILISSDFEEVSRISHRVLVFSRGRIRAELKDDEIKIESLTQAVSC